MSNPEPRDLRELILESAKNLFSQQGYHGLAMRQISEIIGSRQIRLVLPLQG